MESMINWLWLTNIPGIKSTDITALTEHFDTIDDIFAAKDFSGVPGLKPMLKANLKNKSLKTVEHVLNRMQAIGGEILTFDDPRFPDLLRKIDNPPYVLYVGGEIMKWDRLLTIAVVGTRQCTDYGIAAAKHICPGLAESGVTVVSGMARGIDTVSAISAMNAGSKTIAVLGCGLDIVYPPENADVMERIKEHGAVITEYPPGTEPRGVNFPYRNRIISGISRGVLVVEAPSNSGALITAKCALEQGKDIFAVPGSIFKANSAGTNALLCNMAKPATCAGDILAEYSYELKHMQLEKPEKSLIKKIFNKPADNKPKPVNNEIKISLAEKKYAALSEDEKKIMMLLNEGNMHIDDIKRESGIDVSELMSILSMLEFSGFIQKIPGNNYKINI